MLSPTQRLAFFIKGLSYESLPDIVKERAKESVIDTLAVAIAASCFEEVPYVVQEILSHDESSESTVWGYNRKASVFNSALLNGIMGHALELDDVHKESKTHPGTVVIPAVLSVGELLASSGREIIEAIVAGYEVMIRIGMGIGVSSHRLKGWHVTGTAGTFGAAAGVAKLLKLDESQIVSGLGLAGTQSSGLWAFTADGATCKKLHPGHAAYCGVLSAFLSKAGMTGSSRILDAEDGGLFRATSDEYDLSLVTKDLGEAFEIVNVDRKPYACCRSMHPPIDAILKLKKEYNLEPEDIESIYIKTYKVAIKQCAFTKKPVNVAEAKFSMAYGVAVALYDGCALVEQFSPERIRDPKVLALSDKVYIEEDEEFTSRYPLEWGCEVTVLTKRGERFTTRIYAAKGDSRRNPMNTEEIKDKFMRLTQPILKEKAERLYEMLVNMESLKDISELSNLLKT
ncbi:MAG: MmgE/PrpD family protein [Synergistetes bacterium]|nr:MmgE/PrpD family protein [Synergistota bacterium]MDW8192584.1 MmgE/PrpD family protein [Synergistota bacterium]